MASETKELKPRILVVGVGGAGGNAVDNMIEANLQGVEFVVANTDAQAMTRSKTENRIQLGLETTSGLGAGARPEVGAAAAEESLEEINSMLDGAHMVFVAAGLGGGTGTGAAPIIAKTAHDRGILTIGVVTKPFGFEGTHRMATADEGLRRMKEVVDTLIVVPNQNLFRVANERTTFAEAFRMADDVLYCGVRGITDLMIMPGLINLDFADVRTIMKSMGSAMMGMGEGEGEGRAMEAARAAIENPLLDDVSMKGARGVLINITGGYDMTLFELDEAANEIRREVDPEANIILGSTFDSDLEGRIRVSVVAAGLVDEQSEKSSPSPKEDKVNPSSAPDQPVIVGQGRSPETPVKPEPEPEPAPKPEPVQAEVAEEKPSQPRPAPSKESDPVFGRRPGVAPVRETNFGKRPMAESPAGFSSLFGWRRDEPAGANDVEVDTSSADAKPEKPDAAPFDDSDLEIPAFLRRSANN